MDHVYNYLTEKTDKKGFTRFYRFTDSQMEVYRENAIFMALSQSGSGILLRFLCDGDRVWFHTRKTGPLKIIGMAFRQLGFAGFRAMFPKKEAQDPVKPAAKKVKKPKPEKKESSGVKSALAVAVDILVDGKLAASLPPKSGLLSFSFDNPDRRSREISVYFPCLSVLGIKGLESNGSITAAPARKSWLVLGDSITQGFNAGSPATGYVPLLAERFHLDALNQGIAGYVFNPKSLDGLDGLKPKLITVAYGTNDWATLYDFTALEANITAYFKALTTRFPQTPILAITPIWRADIDTASSSGEKLDKVAEVIRRETSAYRNITVVDGFTLVPHEPGLFADGFLHPNRQGFVHYADNLAKTFEAVLPGM
jgi:lysophospholipase L1-like esterase